eukprot:Protomagalhaensia_sp_Gyna_25__4599@NODE_424_length_3479_cov_94_415407_g326_i0_p1_GENE_NODE_424_length_3479_cov_94_415407_g326_i0NODE_424_length_3479_cov_94_415407_g326_i0_p1_ORF_typecomplete_len571_score83_15Fbox/PF00646_33/1_2e03Fbox/PF00646_33/0_0028_NODE_424_length_3479_cov_94_415407_g326_i010862798
MVKTTRIRRPKVRWRRVAPVKEDPEPCTSSIHSPTNSTAMASGATSPAAGVTEQSLKPVATLRDSMRGQVFTLTTIDQEWRQMVTCEWPLTLPEVPRDIAALRGQVAHVLWLCRDVPQLVNELAAFNLVDSMTAMLLCARFIIDGKQAALEMVAQGQYTQFEESSHRGVESLKDVFPPPAVWEYLRSVLGVYSPFFAFNLASLRTDFELVDPTAYKTSLGTIQFAQSIMVELENQRLRYLAAQAILASRLGAGITLNRLFTLLNDMIRFRHVSRKTALTILTAYLIQGSRAAAAMVRLGVAVDCTQTVPSVPRDLSAAERSTILALTLRFVPPLERFRLRSVSRTVCSAVLSPALEEQALLATLEWTAGIPVPAAGFVGISSWHHYLVAAQSWAERQLKPAEKDISDDYTAWRKRLGHLLAGTSITVCFEAYYRGSHAIELKQVLDNLAEPDCLSSATQACATLQGLLCEVEWRDTLLQAEGRLTPHRFLRWANGEEDGVSCHLPPVFPQPTSNSAARFTPVNEGPLQEHIISFRKLGLKPSCTPGRISFTHPTHETSCSLSFTRLTSIH